MKDIRADKLKAELKEMVRFIWPEAEYEYPYDLTSENCLSGIMSFYSPYKNLYGLYEQFLTEYPKRITTQQTIWIDDAVLQMLKRANYVFYDNDDAILEEYKYLSYPSKIRAILFDDPSRFPQLIAAMAAWAVYQGDINPLRDMLAQYRKMSTAARHDFDHQFIDSLSRKRKDVFEHSLKEVKEIIDEMQEFLGKKQFEDPYEEKERKSVLRYLSQGYDEKKSLADLIAISENRRNRSRQEKNFFHRNGSPEEAGIVSDADRYVLLRRLPYSRWNYNIVSENPEDQEYIRRNVRRLAHIDWEDVDELINGKDKHLASQMKVFKDAITCIRKYQIWNTIDEVCPETIEVGYKYPDGKAGDINRGLALCYGMDQPEQIDALNWKVHIDPRKYADIIDMIVNGYLGVINDREKTKQIQSGPQAVFLMKYNNFAKLRAMTSSVYSGEPITQGPYFGIASSVQSNYYHQLMDARNLFYQELITTTGTSSKWKSEQQVYALVRYQYPDAVYQYHASWLGLQSLDIFIPEMSVGIEYQGIQHYEPVDIFGGEEGYKGVVERDERKRHLCEENGVQLIYWKYDEPIKSELLQRKLDTIR